MADQATVLGQDGSRTRPYRVMRRSFGQLAHDITTLAELQAKLLATDLKDCGGRLILPAVLGITGAILAITSLPVLLVGLAYLLYQAEILSLAASLLLVGGIMVILGGGLTLLALAKIRNSLHVLERSRTELARNIDWIKRVMTEQ